ncbi:MAG: glycosyltransferase, partial [candidate division WOR-3 bacterium]
SLVPTVFIAFAVAEALGCRVGMFADTWLGRDGQLSAMQRAMRRLACRYFAQAFVGASMQTLNWYRHYNGGVGTKPFFLSSLCADNEHFKKIRNETMVDRSYDLMFSGRIVTLKNPVFFAEVAVEVRRRFGKCRVLVIGDGDPRLKSKMFRILEDGGVDYHFPGFVKHLELPRYYCQSKLLLFPTSGDCWGVVINEALVSGVPVITTQMTAAAGELVLDGQNGYVLPLESGLWAEKAVTLLRDQDRWMAFSKSAEEMVESFTFEKAAQGIIDAFEYLARSN